MIDKGYEELVSKIDEIKSKILHSDYLKNEAVKEKVRKNWVPYKPRKEEKSFIAIDGGEFIKDLRSTTFYFADAEVIKWSSGEVEVLEGKVLTDVLMSKEGKEFDKEIVSLIMQLLELKLAYKYGDSADYILLDGSLVKKIGSYKFKEKEFRLDDIGTDDKIYAIEMAGNDEKLLLRYLIAENHTVIARLIEKYKQKLLFISKDSRSKELFNERLGDMALFDLFTTLPGHSNLLTKVISGMNLISLKASEKLDGEKYFSSYIRLDEGEKVLKIDMFTNNVERVMDVLSVVNVKGYPYPLLRVHIDAKISREDRRKILQVLNIKKGTFEWFPSQLV